MKPIVLKDLDHASLVINRMAKRMSQRVVGLLSPTVLSVWKEKVETEIIWKFLIPCNGTITNAMVRIPSVNNKNKVTVTLTLGNELKTVSQSFVLARPGVSGVLNVPVNIGDIVTVKVDTLGIEDVSLAAVFVPNMDQYKVETYLLDNIEKQNEGIRDSLDESPNAGATDGLAQPT